VGPIVDGALRRQNPCFVERPKTKDLSTALNISFAIAAGGIRPALSSGGLDPSKMPGRPNSRGRLSLNLYTGPRTKHQK